MAWDEAFDVGLNRVYGFLRDGYYDAVDSP